MLAVFTLGCLRGRTQNLGYRASAADQQQPQRCRRQPTPTSSLRRLGQGATPRSIPACLGGRIQTSRNVCILPDPTFRGARALAPQPRRTRCRRNDQPAVTDDATGGAGRRYRSVQLGASRPAPISCSSNPVARPRRARARSAPRSLRRGPRCVEFSVPLVWAQPDALPGDLTGEAPIGMDGAVHSVSARALNRPKATPGVGNAEVSVHIQCRPSGQEKP